MRFKTSYDMSCDWCGEYAFDGITSLKTALCYCNWGHWAAHTGLRLFRRFEMALRR